jgi:hypothetical protein
MSHFDFMRTVLCYNQLDGGFPAKTRDRKTFRDCSYLANPFPSLSLITLLYITDRDLKYKQELWIQKYKFCYT